MAKVNSVTTKDVNEMAIELSDVKSTDKELLVLVDAFKKIFGATFSAKDEVIVTLSYKYDKDDVPILKAKAVVKEVDVHSDQLHLFDFGDTKLTAVSFNS